MLDQLSRRMYQRPRDGRPTWGMAVSRPQFLGWCLRRQPLMLLRPTPLFLKPRTLTTIHYAVPAGRSLLVTPDLLWSELCAITLAGLIPRLTRLLLHLEQPCRVLGVFLRTRFAGGSRAGSSTEESCGICIRSKDQEYPDYRAEHLQGRLY